MARIRQAYGKATRTTADSQCQTRITFSPLFLRHIYDSSAARIQFVVRHFLVVASSAYHSTSFLISNLVSTTAVAVTVDVKPGLPMLTFAINLPAVLLFIYVAVRGHPSGLIRSSAMLFGRVSPWCSQFCLQPSPSLPDTLVDFQH